MSSKSTGDSYIRVSWGMMGDSIANAGGGGGGTKRWGYTGSGGGGGGHATAGIKGGTRTPFVGGAAGEACGEATLATIFFGSACPRRLMRLP